MEIEEVLQKNKDKLMDIPGVIGIGIGKNQDMKVIQVIIIEEMKNELLKKLPEKLQNFQVQIIESNELKARRSKWKFFQSKTNINLIF